MRKLIIFCLSALMSIGLMAQPPHHHDHEHGHGHSHAPRPVLCASPDQLSMTIQVIGNQSFDDKKLEIAKLAVTLGHFCTDDLARIAELFSFDDSRLAFLLYAYDFCEDPQHYPALRDVFSFQSNYDTLLRSTSSRRR